MNLSKKTRDVEANEETCQDTEEFLPGSQLLSTKEICQCLHLLVLYYLIYCNDIYKNSLKLRLMEFHQPLRL